MFAYRWRISVVRIGKIGAERPVRARAHATGNEARNATRFSTRFSTWNSTRLATPFATRFATFPHGIPHFSTMFLRASFARGKAVRGNGIRRWRRVRWGRKTSKLWKNVEIRALPHAGLVVSFLGPAAGRPDCYMMTFGRGLSCRHEHTLLMIKVAILGGSGYTAVELLKILLRHPHVEVAAVTSRQEGTPLVAELHPSLMGRIDLRCEPFDADKLVARGVQCAFGCLPHGASREAIPLLLNRGLRVVDLSADYRLRDPNVYAHWYKESHNDLAHLAQAVYGLPELYGDKIATAKLVANPGCYPQTAILGLAPLVAGRHIDLASIIVDSASGVSGAGRSPKPNLHFPECNENFSAYNVGTHRHTPEIEQALTDIAGEPVEVIFTPHLAPMDRGIFSTIYATPRRPFTDAQLLELYRGYFAKCPFVRVRDTLPATKDTFGANFLDLHAKAVRGRVIVLACEDNLVRGASGVAVQNFNRMYGFDERTALM